MDTVHFKITRKQKAFINATADEVMFGGAAGGGKSYGQLIDAFLFALKYPGSKQLILRRTFPELDMSLIRVSLELYPKDIYKYNGSSHTGRFENGSIIDFGYCDNENNVIRYQSAEFDVIRFDELTHFTEYMYTYLISRLRGANDFPKQVKSSTNPGGVGHTWVKKRFIAPAPPNTEFGEDGKTRIFIPSLVTDNLFLMKSDPGYLSRLDNLSEDDRRMLKYGDWDVNQGAYFSEFNRSIHVIEPFEIPSHWRRYRALDYGLDMLACYWIAVDIYGRAYVYKELHKPDVIIPDAARMIREMTDKDERITATYAPPDLMNRRQDTGKSVFDTFAENGVPLVKASNNRVQGWYAMKEWLHPFKDELGQTIAGLRIFSTCINLIEDIPALIHDKNNPNDCDTEPHEHTHGPDAIRYFIAGRPSPTPKPKIQDEERPRNDIQSFLSFGT